jgi:prevent-host-death family protein
MHDAESSLAALLDVAQQERVVVTRNGRPSVVLIGVEGFDEEDMDLCRSAKFWQLIQERRKGESISLATLKDRIAKSITPQ